MTDPLDFDGLVEMAAAALYRTEPEMDQPVDLDGRTTGPAFIVPWVTLCECYEPLAETVRQKARAILSAVLPHVLAGPREALVRTKSELAGVPSILRNPVWTMAENIRVAEERVNRALALREAALARIDKLTEGMSREGETG